MKSSLKSQQFMNLVLWRVKQKQPPDRSPREHFKAWRENSKFSKGSAKKALAQLLRNKEKKNVQLFIWIL